MSEEKRFIKNKKVFALSISLVAVCVLAGVLGGSIIFITGDYDELSEDYNDLYGDYETLLSSFNELNETLFILTGEYIELENNYNDLLDEYNTLLNSYNTLEELFNNLTIDYNELNNTYDILLNNYNTLQTAYDTLLDVYNTLLDAYDTLQIAYNYTTETIRQSILPVQYCIFAEAVRRYYMPIYLEGLWELDEKEYWKAFAEFCRDIILHDSGQYNAFENVSNAFSDALRFENDTMNLAWYIMYWTFWSWLPYWELDLTFDELLGIDIIVDWCIDEIDYEWDSDITDGQKYFEWDYIKFPVETAFRTMGDCEDQAILCATYLESCGFETAISIFHDPSHPTEGAFYHGVPLVHIEDTSAFWFNYPLCSLWRLGSGDPYYPDYTWCYLDPTWDVPFGSIPTWLQAYIDIGSISWNIHSTAFCDIDGVIQENLGMTYVMST